MPRNSEHDQFHSGHSPMAVPSSLGVRPKSSRMAAVTPVSRLSRLVSLRRMALGLYEMDGLADTQYASVHTIRQRDRTTQCGGTATKSSMGATPMRGMNRRQTTIQRIRSVKRKQHAMHKGGKRVPVSRRGPGK